jgi:hypothetical protein
MRWEQGRARIDGMLATGQLERVTASREHAERLLAQARAHLALATSGDSADLDPIGAYQLLYDASRKALSAVLENQGLRATSRGGHVAVLDAVRAQLDPPMGAALRPFDRMRRMRNAAEYPRDDRPAVTAEDIRRDQEHAEVFIELAERVLDQMSAY